MRPHYIVLLFILSSSLFLTSCLTGNEQQDNPSRFAIDFQLENASETQITEEDTLEISEVRFLQGQVVLRTTAADSAVLFSDVGLYSYPVPHSELARILTGNLAGGIYDTMSYAIEKAAADNTNIPDEFVDGEGEDERYSMIILGRFNQSDFEYKSTEFFNLEFGLGSPVDVPENNTTLTLGVNFDIHQAFLDSAGSNLLDPSDPDNAELIDSNIEAAIELLPFN